MSYASPMALQDTQSRTFGLRIQPCNMLHGCVMICNRIPSFGFVITKHITPVIIITDRFQITSSRVNRGKGRIHRDARYNSRLAG